MKYISGLLMIILLVSACAPAIDTCPDCKVCADNEKECPACDECQACDCQDTQTASFDGVKKFDTAQQILEYLEDNQGGSFASYGLSRNMAVDMDFAMAEAAVKTSAPQAAGGDDGASEFSQTNVQVEGVDEADIVKNDGKYIYMVNQENLVIVDAFPADDAEVVYEEELDGRPRNLFINDDRLIVFLEDDSQVYSIQPYDYMPRPRYVQQTRVLVYDVSDRSEPDMVEELKLTGNYFESRMIGNHVYFIVKDSVYYYNQFVDVPMVRVNGGSDVFPEVFYFDNPEDNYVFHTISSFDVRDPSDVNSKSYLMGYSNTLYVSEDNIYIAYQKNYNRWYYEDDREEKFFDVVLPELSNAVQSKIKAVDKDAKPYERWMKISEILDEMYEDMSETQQDTLIQKIMDAVEEYDVKKEMERSKTIIHKVKIDDGDIEYDTSGEVEGYLLNQFSLDEHKGNLRVATTTRIWTGRSIQYNNVFVLDEDMDQIGELTEIAPDESIYSTRFMGDRLYMVTFKRIDPFFVIDLSDPEDPEILGELKIPGYSDYLHPYDEDHIIGIGKETDSNEWGGTSVKGVKLALFDVSDVKNPTMVDKYEIGDRGTDSEALQDHKAFLFDKEKNILVIPIREVNSDRIYENGYYSSRVWQGAYVFGLDPDDGFELKGKISHMEGLEKYYYYYSGNAVRRALYMDDVLYTVSGKKIEMNDIDTMRDIGSVELPYDEDGRWWWY